MNPIHMILAMTDDVTYYGGWDKVGAVAVSVMMLGIMMLLHRAGLKRVDSISDRHMEFVEKQVEVLTELKASNDSMRDAAQSMHRRMDVMLSCRYHACPVKRFLTDAEKAEN